VSRVLHPTDLTHNRSFQRRVFLLHW